MERAGLAVAEEVIRSFPAARRIALVCGGGANGGDGRIAARHLRAAGCEVVETDEAQGFDLVIDALFGTGFVGVPRPEAAALLRRMNAAGCPVVSVDVPSGVDASSGEADDLAVNATLTVTFHGPKVGLVVSPGRERAGRVVVAGIGLVDPAGVSTRVHRATPSVLRDVPLRSGRDSKYTAGHVVVVGGSVGMAGAVALTAMAALRADAGYVTAVVPDQVMSALEALVFEPVKRGFSWDTAVEIVRGVATRGDALAIGPGLGRSPEAQRLVRAVLGSVSCPVVVDADGLHGLEPIARTGPLVLTPHSGELAHLLGVDSDWVDRHRLRACSEAASTFGAVVVLKGPDTIVASPDGDIVVCDLGPPSLATAGTGDVLTGIVAAFLAKALDPMRAVPAAVVAHSLAARAVEPQSGLVASDVVGEIPRAVAQFACS
jgi:NAD(P)H-hydrate epimerase